MIIFLPQAVVHWGSADFSSALKKEIIELGVGNLPIQKAIAPGKFINDPKIDVTILTASENTLNIEVKIGILFSETQWGYCCGEEEPMISNAYCEVYLSINKITSKVEFEVL